MLHFCWLAGWWLFMKLWWAIASRKSASEPTVRSDDGNFSLFLCWRRKHECRSMIDSYIPFAAGAIMNKFISLHKATALSVIEHSESCERMEAQSSRSIQSAKWLQGRWIPPQWERRMRLQLMQPAEKLLKGVGKARENNWLGFIKHEKILLLFIGKNIFTLSRDRQRASLGWWKLSPFRLELFRFDSTARLNLCWNPCRRFWSHNVSCETGECHWPGKIVKKRSLEMPREGQCGWTRKLNSTFVVHSTRSAWPKGRL